MPLYSKKIIDHFKKPKNVGKIKGASGQGEAGNLSCGDLMRIYLKIEKNKKGQEVIKEARFETLGCIVAIANSSLLTSMVKGKTLKEALKLTKDDLIKALGKPLPPFKTHCSLLALDALFEAIYDYYKKKRKKIPLELEKEHKGISRAREEVEKRYKGLRDLERKILK